MTRMGREVMVVLRRRRDDGFSVVEVVIAAAILFIALTALLGLLGVSTNLSVAAKRRAVLTNAMSWYADHIRSMPYERIAPTPDGDIAPTDTRTFGEPGKEITVVFTNRVSYPDGEQGSHLRTVNVTARCTLANKTYTSSMVIHVKNPEDDTTAATIRDINAPVVEWVSPTPAPNSVLFGSQVGTTRDMINLHVTASSPNDHITKVEFKIGTSLVVDASGNSASFDFGTDQTAVDPDTGWDTVNEGISEGFQTVTVVVTDDQGRTSTIDRQFIIDNAAPGIPGPVALGYTPDSRRQMNTLAFRAAPDGYHAWAYRYRWYLYREPASTVVPLSDWVLVREGSASPPTPAGDIAAAVSYDGTITAQTYFEPFSRFVARARAGSPLEIDQLEPSTVEASYMSRPEVVNATATVTVAKVAVPGFPRAGVYYSIDALVTAPNFPHGTLTRDSFVIQYADTSLETPVWTNATVTWLADPVEEAGRMRVRFIYYNGATPINCKRLAFRCGISVTPTGWGGGSLQGPYFTNAAGPTPFVALPGGSIKSASSPATPLTLWW